MAREKNKPEPHDPTLGPVISAVNVGGESVLDRLLPHAKKIGLALAGAALLVTAVFTYRYFQHRKSERSTSRLVKALELVERPVRHDEPGLPPQEPDPDMFNTDAERTDAVVAAMAKVGENRAVASLVEAQVLLQAGKLDDALAIYRKRSSAGGIEGPIAREGIGIVLEAQATAAKDPAAKQKLLEDSLAAFRSIQTDDKGPRRDYALYHEARLLEALGKPTEAKAALEKALAVVPDTALEPAIKNRLSALGGGA